MAKVDRRAPDECWPWIGVRTKNGYGQFWYAGSNRTAHRISFMLFNGYLPDSKIDICHKCDVRHCVNPSHLFAGTRSVNILDMSNKGRHQGQKKTKCPHGHLYTSANTYRSAALNGARSCMTCKNNRRLLSHIKNLQAGLTVEGRPRKGDHQDLEGHIARIRQRIASRDDSARQKAEATRVQS